MAHTYRFGTKQRDQTWALEIFAAYRAGRGDLPICVHCDQPVHIDQMWDVAHVDIPRSFGGKSVGCGHRRCNHLDNYTVVAPMLAKAERVRKKNCGITGPGLGPSPMQAGRRSRLTKTMRNGVQPRLTLAEKHQRFLARRQIIAVDAADFSEPLEVYP